MLLKKKPLLEAVLLLMISALVYLPNLGRLSYFKDDWYYMYDGLIAGAKVFHPMFSIDRPARGYFFEIYYSLFGPYPLPYHIGAFVWRALAVVAALWLFNILWPKQRSFVFFAVLLFAIYPGYYWWVGAIEYQPMIASLALQVFSIALTLKAIETSDRVPKIIYAIGAILTGWIYIALVDYAIGAEAFRFLCAYIFVNRDDQFSTISKKVFVAIKVSSWNLLIPFGFILWRTFFFNNERKATDVGLQLSAFFSSPVSTGTVWFLQSFNSLLNLSVLAWTAQFQRFIFGMRLRDIAFALCIAGFVVLMVILAERFLREDNDSVSESKAMVNNEALLIGILGMIFGILPVILANRYINLEGYSHYALPSSMAAAVTLMGFVYTLASRQVRLVSLYAVIVFASLAHYGISASALDEENAIKKFWWQAGWRIPALRAGATLVINYPSGNIGDDGNGVMEAPNMIYFPQPNADIPVHYNISAITLNNANLKDVLVGKLFQQSEYRSHSVDYDYSNLLVFSQPSSTSCVHVINGQQPLISVFDPGNIVLAAPSSNIENVIVDSKSFTPPDFAFGKEPEHKWCFYYEKAELALQAGNWTEAASLGEQAIRLNFHPEDQSEWLPFLEAYAITGNAQRVKQTAPKINLEKSLRLQACNMLTNIKVSLTPEVRELISAQYCRNAE